MTALKWGSATDVGMVRSNNQDQLLVATPLFAVADGMGGHAAGEVASRIAVEALKAAFDEERTPGALVHAVEEANRAVWQRAQQEAAFRGMGTTLCAIALVSEGDEDELAVVNVGDSRIYLLRDGELEQLTTDHTLVQELVTDGQLSEAEADVHPQRHVLTRALGVDPEVEVDLITVLPYQGDRFMLCSDGLPREVSDSQAASLLRRLADPEEAAKELVAEARARGGNDNITVVIVDVVDDDDRAATASAALAAEPGGSIESHASREPATDEANGATTKQKRRPLEVPDEPRSHLLTLRVKLFFLLVIGLLAATLTAVGFYARGTYFVGLRGNAVIIFKGKPGGVLWFKPTVAEDPKVAATDVPTHVDDLKAGKEEATLSKAREFVRNIRAEAASRLTTTATTIATTTTAAPTAASAPPTVTP